MSAGMLELTHLEAMLEDEVECQAVHTHNGVLCSVKITHRFVVPCTDWDKLACQNTALWVASVGTIICGGCYKPVADCWRVVPV